MPFAQIYGPLNKYPYADGHGRSLHPDASVAEYRAILDNLGIERAVIVQPSAYGTDNSRTLDAMRELGSDNARGIAVCRTDVSREELASLHEAGMRGFRWMIYQPSCPGSHRLAGMSKCRRTAKMPPTGCQESRIFRYRSWSITSVECRRTWT
jgi:predicted TIM-barrel fold metal-dependent hydrolase